MNILCVCDEGNNRAVQFAHLLKYKYGADTIPVGLNTTSEQTLNMLYSWADWIIVVDKNMVMKIPINHEAKIKLWEVEDKYPRPFNSELFRIAKRMIEQNPL